MYFTANNIIYTFSYIQSQFTSLWTKKSLKTVVSARFEQFFHNFIKFLFLWGGEGVNATILRILFLGFITS